MYIYIYIERERAGLRRRALEREYVTQPTEERDEKERER